MRLRPKRARQIVACRPDLTFTCSCIVCTYNLFAFHFVCPKWAAARHTRSKSKLKSCGLRCVSIALMTISFGKINAEKCTVNIGNNNPFPIHAGELYLPLKRSEEKEKKLEYRRLMRMVAGPPADSSNWASPREV